MRAILAVILVTIGFHPVVREIAPAAAGRSSCDCSASASCPLRGTAGSCASTCRHGGGRPDGWNADCGCRHPGPQGSVAGRELPALPASVAAVRLAAVVRLVEEPATAHAAWRPRAPDSPPPRA